ncbi:MAG: hypothetical protein KAJ63_07735 [Methyloprofundus sp.]|nr:hypothetical protein [Methyloprofundus sp.]
MSIELSDEILLLKKQANKFRFLLKELDKDNMPTAMKFLDVIARVNGSENWQLFIRRASGVKDHSGFAISKYNTEKYAEAIISEYSGFSIDEVKHCLSLTY